MLGFVAEDLQSGGLQDEVVLPGTGQDIGVVAVPSVRTARVRQQDQDGPLLSGDTEMKQEFAQLFGPDPPLPRFDPADLRLVALQQGRRVFQRVAQALCTRAAFFPRGGAAQGVQQ